jgi:hypothetical protein
MLRTLAVLALASAGAACSTPPNADPAAQQADVSGWHARPWLDEALRTPYTADIGDAFISNAQRGWYR